MNKNAKGVWTLASARGHHTAIPSYPSSATVTASAGSGYTFYNWTENGTPVSTSDSYSFTVTVDRALVANFTVEEPTKFVGFALTVNAYLDSSDWNVAVTGELGADYQVADWNDLVAYHNGGGDLLMLYDALHLTNHNQSASVTKSGDPSYSSTRYYYASRHEHSKPGNYLAHANIDNYLMSLGSWPGTRKILAIHKSFDPSAPESTVVSAPTFTPEQQGSNPNGLTFEWFAIPNRYHTLWATDNLSTNDWYPVVPHTNETSVGGTMKATITNLNHSAEFYKVGVSLDPVDIPLALNDDFDGETYEGWSYWYYSSYGTILVGTEDGALHIKRSGAGGSGGGRGIEYFTDIALFDSTSVRFDVYPVSSSVRNGTGDGNGEYPAKVILIVETPAGDRSLEIAYRQITTSKPNRVWSTGYLISHTSVSGWRRAEEFRIREYFPSATRIKSILLCGTGWDFESYFDNIEISW